MNAEELAKFKQLLAAYDQALLLQRMRERTIETYRQYLWTVAKHFNRCPDDLSRGSGIQKRLTIRSLRHAYATHLLELGMDMRLIQDLMGHQDSKTTAHYAHITKTCRDHTADRLQSLLEGFVLRWEDQP